MKCGFWLSRVGQRDFAEQLADEANAKPAALSKKAKQKARVASLATMDEEHREDEDEQDPVLQVIIDHFKRDGSGNFELPVRKMALELMTRDISLETASQA